MLRYILLILTFISYSAFSQSTKWADKVIEFSSELSPVQYGSIQILGEPNVPLTGGDNPNAWSPRRTDNLQFIKVGFDEPMRIQQIFIHESFNPGSVFQVYSYDENDNEYLMATGNPRPIPLGARQTNFFFEMTQHPVVAIKVVIDGEKVPGENSIDAIGISDSNIPINVQLRIATNVNEELKTERLSDNVNSPYVEHSPLLSPDGKTLFFSRANHPENVGGVDDYEDIWYSEWDEENQEWKEAKNIGDRLNTKGPNFISSITPDGNNLVLLLGNKYTNSGKMRAGLSISTKGPDGEWTEPMDVEIVNDYNYSPKSDYFLANSKDVLMLAVERDNTFGYRDLYVCFDLGNGKWSEPLNIGSDVNTSNEESAPFLAPDMKTLYFSSNGYAGYGGNDIYVTKRLDDTWTRWSPPENMGAGINSETDDIYFNLPEVGEYGYFTKGDKEEDTDIYRFELKELYKSPEEEEPVIADAEEEEPKAESVMVKGKIIDTKTGKPHAGDVVFERLPDGKEIGRTQADPETGEYEIELPVGAKYGIRAESEGYLPTSENIDLNEAPEVVNVDLNLKLTPIEPTATVVINNIFFDFDKAVLKTSSYSELERLLKFLNDKQINKVKIEGHADSTGPESYNLGLSKRRAQSVSNYLKENGVSSDRIVTEWFGETKPAVPNDSRANRAKNRRVEFEVVE
jgi:outer membrane protein OmpA-like peptidoglycan-associated protein